MKTSRFTILWIILMICYKPIIAQKVGFDGLTKGTIDTEVLTAIIQSKQEELKEKVFRDVVINYFNRTNSKFNNFATYYYIYNVMETIIAEKNKTIITRNILQHTSEFALTYAITAYCLEYGNANHLSQTERENLFEALGVIFPYGELTKAKAKALYDVNQAMTAAPSDDYSLKMSDLKENLGELRAVGRGAIDYSNPRNNQRINLLLDVVFDLLINNEEIKSRKIFKDKFEKDPEVSIWYQADSRYQLYANSKVDSISKAAKVIRGLMKKNVDGFIKNYDFVEQVVKQVPVFLETTHDAKTMVMDYFGKVKAGNITLTAALDALVKTELFKNLGLTEAELKAQLDKLYQTMTGMPQYDKVAELFSKDNVERFVTLYKFYNDLKAEDIGLTELTQEQYLAMRTIIRDVIEKLSLKFENSVVAKVSDFVLEYTLIQEETTDHDKKTTTIYVDIESLVSALDQHYNSSSRKSSMSSKYWIINPRPFLTIGTNYGYFIDDTNVLRTDADGNVNDITNYYYASEKVGLKVKLFDTKYTRSFKPGETFTYKGTRRVWKRPRKQTVVSDMYYMVYASGLLYNLVNLKSEESFDQAIVGTGLGMTFFNGLAISASMAVPFTQGSIESKNWFFNLGFDIPIIEYLGQLNKKE
ncbi:hypothetical protein SAMN04488029_0123 [Reichenbachiella faecimaris]|uniref:Uncharacterized protein n=1 Tax=Reichenbachiella faecimaris TaxID=692418 RepID=A0A1W2G667_REIFA|nr:hypothetical protein [Reichenbachiella faecimaris]SMD31786.1 hypothetical protein SAMN04488029_0123 [Reichenbachiella faecimaris]